MYSTFPHDPVAAARIAFWDDPAFGAQDAACTCQSLLCSRCFVQRGSVCEFAHSLPDRSFAARCVQHRCVFRTSDTRTQGQTGASLHRGGAAQDPRHRGHRAGKFPRRVDSRPVDADAGRQRRPRRLQFGPSHPQRPQPKNNPECRHAAFGADCCDVCRFVVLAKCRTHDSDISGLSV